MCTVTYIPLARAAFGNADFVLTHSRDEKAVRPAALPPRPMLIAGQEVTFPRDPQGRGTWIASSATRSVCLLNGGFVPHEVRQPYGSGPGGEPQPKHSRGLVVLDAFEYASTDAFVLHYPMAGIEPFTLLLTETDRLVELRWTGNRLFVSEKDPSRPYIWSSVTLYPPDVIRQRESWFADWQRQTPVWSETAIRQFHHTAGDAPENALRMKRQDQYLTVSLTSIRHQNGISKLQYEAFDPAPGATSYRHQSTNFSTPDYHAIA